jgi:GWxTD domain-containing protein
MARQALGGGKTHESLAPHGGHKKEEIVTAPALLRNRQPGGRLPAMLRALGLVLALTAGRQTSGLPQEIGGKPLAKLLEEWPEQYVKWILTKSERNAYLALATDEERLEFIEFFWARRDPNPATVENEYRREYLERYAFVMNRLSAGRPGWSNPSSRTNFNSIGRVYSSSTTHRERRWDRRRRQNCYCPI